jgi:hypothetical protein
MKPPPSPQKLAKDFREALERTGMTPKEYREFLEQAGIIDRNGRVIGLRAIGDQVPQKDGVELIPAPGGMALSPFPSPTQLAQEALEALEHDTRTSEEHWESLVQAGIIDHQGRVICMKLFGGDGHQEENGPKPRPTPRKKKKRKKD